MATERLLTPRSTRRTWLGQLAIAGLAPWLSRAAWANATSKPATLLAAWQTPNAHQIGLVEVGPTQWQVARSIAVPTRAHGLAVEPGGSVLALARRPGDWLLRWHPTTGDSQWQWIEGDRRFNGHVAASPQGDTLWTTETDLETAQGLVGVRDNTSLQKKAEWTTQGRDPHALMVLPQALGRIPAGSLIVANGGISALPETGRAKRGLDRMDASLVALSPQTGAVLGQWRLIDPDLSIRHLAWDPVSQRLGIALQAEHADDAQRLSAPVLAVWDGGQLVSSVAQPSLQGYGGDICARPGGGFVVSCPRADTLALFNPAAVWQHNQPHRDVCALAKQADQWWASGPDGVLTAAPSQTTTVARATAAAEPLQFDNHWLNWPRN
jgi:hypothetical protein